MALSMGKWLSLTGEIGVEQLYRSKTILEFMLTGKGDEFYSGTLEKLRFLFYFLLIFMIIMNNSIDRKQYLNLY